MGEIFEIKFYNAKTGEEVLPYVTPPRDEQKEQELEMLRKQTGYYYPELCPNCGQYYEGYDGHYEIDGDIRCKKCVSEDKRLKLPFFAPEIPAYVDGAVRKIFTFKDSNDLYGKMMDRLNEDEILVKSGSSIMSQSTIKSYWWVFGYINNYDIELLNIPTFNSDVYNEDKTVNVEKMDEWLKGKDIINGNRNEN